MHRLASWGSAAVIITIVTTSATEAATVQEDLVRDWLRGMSFGLNVSIGSSTFDPVRQAVDLENVVIGGTDALVRVTYPRLSIEDPRKNGAGMFAAHAIRASEVSGVVRVDPRRWFPEITAAMDAAERASDDDESARGAAPTDQPSSAQPDDPVETASFEIAFEAESMLYERVVAPMKGPDIAPSATELDRILAYARWALETRADWIEVNNVVTRTTGLPEGDGETRYALQYVSGLHDGRIERMGFNDMVQTTTVGGTTETVRTGGSYAVGLDMKAALDVLDPAAYENGVGDGVWRTVALQQGYNDISAEFEGGTFKIGNVEANGLRVRQTEKPVLAVAMGYLADPARVEDDPAAFVRDIVPGLLGFYGVDFVQMRDLAVTGPDNVSFGIEQVDLNDLDSDGLGALTLRGMNVGAGEAGSGSIGMITFNGIGFGDLMAWVDLGIASETGEPTPDMIRDAVLDGSPTLNFFEMTELSVQSPMGEIGIDAIALTQGDWLRALPRRYDLTLTNLAFPAELAGDPVVVDQLSKMGYDRLSVSGGLSFAWDTGRGDIRVEDLTANVADMARISMSAHLGNLPLSILDDPDTIEQRMAEGTIVSGSFVFGNQSIVERTFEMKAAEMNQEAETFRENFAAALPLMLGFLDDPQIQKTFAGALKSFFEDPQSLKVTIDPAAPLPFSILETIETEAPGDVLKLLGFDIKANQ